MTPLMASAIARLCGGHLAGGDVRLEGVGTDTRLLPDANGRALLFVALRGERFDGHLHVREAAARGAAAVMVEAEDGSIQVPQIVVSDTLLALRAWAAGLQQARTTKIAAITGSNGKTSVKTLLHAILATQGEAYANPGNHNNEIGLPLAVINAPENARFAVYEMGAGKPGDIAYLTAAVRPDVALVNNIAPAHLERMGTLFGIAETKGAIYDALKNGGTAVINADDAFAPYFAERSHGHRILRFGLDAPADLSARNLQATTEGMHFILEAKGEALPVALPLPGRHNVANALAASAMALALGIAPADCVRGLAQAHAVPGRLVRERLADGRTLIDDSYNANPGSAAAAIDLLAASPGERWLVLGDMRELGKDEIALHAEIGRRAKAAGIEHLVTCGPLSAHAAAAFGVGASACTGHAQVIEALRGARGPQHVLLVKGSRGSAMDVVVQGLRGTGAMPHAA